MKAEAMSTAKMDTQQRTGSFEDMDRPDHDERLYNHINLATSTVGAPNPPARGPYDNPSAQDEIDQCHDQIARQASQIHQLQIQVENLTMQLDTMHERYKGIHNESSHTQQSLQTRLQHLTTALQNTQKQLLHKESSTASQSRVIDELKGKLSRLEIDLQNKTKENDAIATELQQYEIGVLAGSAQGGMKHGGGLSVSAMKMELE